MPIKFKIIKDENLILAKGYGTVTGQDVLKHIEALATDNGYTSPMKKLIDYRSIDDIKISPDEAMLIARKKKVHSAKFTDEMCAFVCPKDFSYGTSRVHQTLTDNAEFNTEIFRDIKDALGWLNITIKIDLS